MDTITEDKMAIEIAKLGGLGIIHRYCTIEKQVNMVKKVKRYTNYLITEPYKVKDYTPMKDVLNILVKKGVKSLLLVDDNDFLIGIFTNRDKTYFEHENLNEEFMDSPVSMFASKKLKTIDKEKFQKSELKNIVEILTVNKIQKLPIVNGKKIYGLVTLKDMLDRSNKLFIEKANLDKNSQLVVGAAVGVNKDYIERTKALLEVGCNIICVDVAHGHHKLCGRAIREIKKKFPKAEIIAGNVCTSEGVAYLYNCGADCVKVGVGPGSICTTRKQTGCGAPQFSAVLDCANVARDYGKTIIADGGHNRTIGNIFKALCAGASASMLGGSLSGTLETPGQIYTKMDKKVKQIRGMAGILSNYSKAKKMGEDTKHLEQITPEGVEGYVPYKGPVKDIVNQIIGGLRSGLSYVGVSDLEGLKYTNLEFLLITSNGLRESGSHNIKEL